MIGRLLISFYLIALFSMPSMLAYELAGWRWAVMTVITTIGCIAFLYQFGPWILGKWIAKAIIGEVDRSIEWLDVLHDLDDAKANHAAAEGVEV